MKRYTLFKGVLAVSICVVLWRAYPFHLGADSETSPAGHAQAITAPHSPTGLFFFNSGEHDTPAQKVCLGSLPCRTMAEILADVYGPPNGVGQKRVSNLLAIPIHGAGPDHHLVVAFTEQLEVVDGEIANGHVNAPIMGGALYRVDTTWTRIGANPTLGQWGAYGQNFGGSFDVSNVKVHHGATDTFYLRVDDMDVGQGYAEMHAALFALRPNDPEGALRFLGSAVTGASDCDSLSPAGDDWRGELVFDEDGYPPRVHVDARHVPDCSDVPAGPAHSIPYEWDEARQRIIMAEPG